MRVQTLGATDLLTESGEPVRPAIRQSKRLALLCYLAVSHPHRMHRRDVLVEMFWPELDTRRARAALRQSLYYLRNALPEFALLSEGESVGIDPERVRCHAREFQELLDEGNLDAALMLYRGDLLPGLFATEAPGFERWLEVERGRLRDLAAQAAWELSSADHRAENLAGAAHWARRGMELRPVDEAGFRQLLKLLDALGDRAGAEREYRHFSQRLRQDYQLEPTPETQLLATTIRVRSDARPLAERQSSPTTSQRPPTIAVLPFTEMNAEPGAPPIAEGLADDVITDLARIHGLRVIARTSTARLREDRRDIGQVGRDLGAHYVLEGSIGREDGRLRVNARLIDAREGAPVWAERFSGSMHSVLEIQQSLARRIVDGLSVALSSAEEHSLSQPRLATFDEFECYHRARAEMFRMTPPALDRAVRIAKDGVHLLGPTELLLSTLGMAYIYHIMLGSRPDETSLLQAERCAERVLEINPASVPGHVLRGMVRFKSGDPELAVGDLEAARRQEPNNRDALFMLAILYIISGRTRHATPVVETLLHVDPLTGLNHCLPGYIHAHHGEFSEALPYYERMLDIEPSNIPNRWCFAQLAIRAGQFDRSSELIESVIRRALGSTFAQQAEVLRHALSGNGAAASRAITPELAAAARWDEHSSWWLGSALAIGGQLEDAMPWLENATRLGCVDHPFLSRLDPCLENLRGTQGFERLMSRVKRRWEALQH